MEIEKIQIENELHVAVKGNLDTQTSEFFRTEIADVDFTSLQKIVLDFSELKYISSTGLRELLIIKKRLNPTAELCVLNPCKVVEDVINTTGFNTFIRLIKISKAEVQYNTFSFKELLENRVKISPEKICFNLIRNYTFSDIEKCSEIIAMDLHKIGVRRGTHVALCGLNSANWIFTFFAIQKIGALAIFLNSGLTEEGIIKHSQIGDITHICLGDSPQILDFAASSSLITQSEKSKITKIYDIRSHIDFTNRFAEYDDIKGLFEQKIGFDDPAIMIFSSGSTGIPKGVLLSSFNAINSIVAVLERLPEGVCERQCLFLPFFHIFGFINLISPFVVEITLYIPEKLKTDIILKTISENRCTYLASIPTMMLAIMNNKEFSSEKVESLQYCVLGGAAIQEPQLVLLTKQFARTHFLITYGLSECAPASISLTTDSLARITTTVGKPCNGVEVKIDSIDGGVGEIFLKSNSFMTGYYKSEIDKQAVLDDGWLQTGDLGFVDEDGYLHISGRKKEIIIRGGENILPNEVASAISEFPAIADVRIMGIPDSFFGEIVVAAIVVKTGQTYNETALRDFLANKIEKQKIPTHITIYKNFPMLPNGKIDMVRLKKEFEERYGK